MPNTAQQMTAMKYMQNPRISVKVLVYERGQQFLAFMDKRIHRVP